PLRSLVDEAEQVVRDALHRRDDDAQVVAAALAADDAGHAANAARVGNTGAAELVHGPSHDSILWGKRFLAAASITERPYLTRGAPLIWPSRPRVAWRRSSRRSRARRESPSPRRTSRRRRPRSARCSRL